MSIKIEIEWTTGKRGSLDCSGSESKIVQGVSFSVSDIEKELLIKVRKMLCWAGPIKRTRTTVSVLN